MRELHKIIQIKGWNLEYVSTVNMQALFPKWPTRVITTENITDEMESLLWWLKQNDFFM